MYTVGQPEVYVLAPGSFLPIEKVEKLSLKHLQFYVFNNISMTNQRKENSTSDSRLPLKNVCM